MRVSSKVKYGFSLALAGPSHGDEMMAWRARCVNGWERVTPSLAVPAQHDVAVVALDPSRLVGGQQGREVGASSHQRLTSSTGFGKAMWEDFD